MYLHQTDVSYLQTWIKKNEITFCGQRKKLLLNIMSVKLVVIVIIVFKRYSSTYYLMQCNCVIRSNFIVWNMSSKDKNNYQ